MQGKRLFLLAVSHSSVCSPGRANNTSTLSGGGSFQSHCTRDAVTGSPHRCHGYLFFGLDSSLPPPAPSPPDCVLDAVGRSPSSNRFTNMSRFPPSARTQRARLPRLPVLTCLPLPAFFSSSFLVKHTSTAGDEGLASPLILVTSSHETPPEANFLRLDIQHQTDSGA